MRQEGSSVGKLEIRFCRMGNINQISRNCRSWIGMSSWTHIPEYQEYFGVWATLFTYYGIHSRTLGILREYLRIYGRNINFPPKYSWYPWIWNIVVRLQECHRSLLADIFRNIFRGISGNQLFFARNNSLSLSDGSFWLRFPKNFLCFGKDKFLLPAAGSECSLLKIAFSERVALISFRSEKEIFSEKNTVY